MMGEPVSPRSILGNSDEPYHLMELVCMKAQHEFCRKIEMLEQIYSDKVKFKVDKWKKDDSCEPSGGVTCVMEGGIFEKLPIITGIGKIFERAGVNVSAISGKLSKDFVSHMRHRGLNETHEGCNFRVAGISSVIHPVNPFCPTMHFNFRYFHIIVNPKDGSKDIWWFGGGADLTPYYLFEKDAKHFHSVLKRVCDEYDKDSYMKFKKWCDEYFFIKHRGECRGVGGIFFDDLCAPSLEECLNFVKNGAFCISSAYLPIIEERKRMEYNENHKNWQLLRRGRGTKFGFNMPGSRIESILMSLPKVATWEYCHKPESGSEEEKLLNILKTPIDWI